MVSLVTLVIFGCVCLCATTIAKSSSNTSAMPQSFPRILLLQMDCTIGIETIGIETIGYIELMVVLICSSVALFSEHDRVRIRTFEISETSQWISFRFWCKL
eukprot:441808_1